MAFVFPRSTFIQAKSWESYVTLKNLNDVNCAIDDLFKANRVSKHVQNATANSLRPCGIL